MHITRYLRVRYKPLIYTSKSYMYLTRNNAWEECHKTIPGNHICTSHVPKRERYMPQNYNRKSYMYLTRSKTRGTHAKKPPTCKVCRHLTRCLKYLLRVRYITSRVHRVRHIISRVKLYPLAASRLIRRQKIV